MPAIDTNVLVRFVVADDAVQSAAAKRLIQSGLDSGHWLHVPVTVTLELEWVLRSSYGFGKPEVVTVLSNLLSAVELQFDSERALEAAVHLYREGAADFADCLHLALANQAGELPFWTFDKRAAKLTGAQAMVRSA
jgi:predicted nucleic-acid-binding protein